jgi:hypothetical protein
MELNLTKEDINNNRGAGGLGIHIQGVLGSPADPELNTCPIFIEYYQEKVLVHIWDGKEDPTTITLTNKR